MSAKRNQATEDKIVLGELVANMAGELARLSTTAGRLDEEIGHGMESGPGRRPSTELIQEVDLLRQSIECIATLTGNLAQQPLPQVAVSSAEVAAGVYLGDLRDACLGTGAAPEPAETATHMAARAS